MENNSWLSPTIYFKSILLNLRCKRKSKFTIANWTIFSLNKLNSRALFQIVWDLKMTLASDRLLATNVRNDAKWNKTDTPKSG